MSKVFTEDKLRTTYIKKYGEINFEVLTDFSYYRNKYNSQLSDLLQIMRPIDYENMNKTVITCNIEYTILEYIIKKNKNTLLNKWVNFHELNNYPLEFDLEKVLRFSKSTIKKILKYFMDHNIPIGDCTIDAKLINDDSIIILQEYGRFKCKFVNISEAIDNSSRKLLKAWFDLCENYNVMLEYTEKAIDNADISKLKLWFSTYKRLNLILKYTNKSIDNASIDMLNLWFKMYELDNKIKLKYTKSAFMGITDKGLNIWIKMHNKYNEIELKFPDSLVDKSDYDRLQLLLNAHVKHNIKLKYTAYAIDNASYYRLKLWFDTHKTHNIPLKYTYKAFEGITIDRLKLWFDMYENYNIKFEYNASAIDNASYNVLKLWFDGYENLGIPLKYTHKAMNEASGQRLKLWVDMYDKHKNIKLLFNSNITNLVTLYDIINNKYTYDPDNYKYLLKSVKNIFSIQKHNTYMEITEKISEIEEYITQINSNYSDINDDIKNIKSTVINIYADMD